MYSINFIESNKNFCLRLHYNGANFYLFVNGTKIHKFKAKNSEIVATPFFSRKHFKRLENIKKTGLNGYVCDFSVDYDTIAADETDKYLMENNNMI